MADEWESVLDRWSAELDQEGWVTLAEAQAATGVSRSALRSWYRKGELASRLRDGPHGPERLVPLDALDLVDSNTQTRSAREAFTYETGWGLPPETDIATMRSSVAA